MARPPRPVFLARSNYRRKRLRDAARLLPVMGMALLLVPLLWIRSGSPGGVGNAAALLYVFGIWAALIGLAFLLSGWLLADGEEGEEEP